MTAKEYRKSNRDAGREIGKVYFSQHGNRLAEKKEGVIGWRQESLNPKRNTKVFYWDGGWQPQAKPYVETRCWPQTDDAGFSYPYMG